MFRSLIMGLCLASMCALGACADPLSTPANAAGDRGGDFNKPPSPTHASAQQDDDGVQDMLVGAVAGYAVASALQPSPTHTVHERTRYVPVHAHRPAGTASRSKVTIPTASPAPRIVSSPSTSSSFRSSPSFRSYSGYRSSFRR